MGLAESRVISSLHPWLGVRLEWMGEVARIVGSKQNLFSGFRSYEEQLALYDRLPTGRPVAYPGCSQHNYGFAADGSWDLITQVTSKGRPKIFTSAETVAFMNSAARHVGLVLVANDDGHFQVYPGIQFKEWAVSWGFCNPNPPEPRWFTQFKIEDAIDSAAGFRDEIVNLLNLPRLGGS